MINVKTVKNFSLHKTFGINFLKDYLWDKFEHYLNMMATLSEMYSSFDLV